jgi:hypothetical protein
MRCHPAAHADVAMSDSGHTSFARDYEYKRHGTLSLLAGIDLLTGKVHALVKDPFNLLRFSQIRGRSPIAAHLFFQLVQRFQGSNLPRSN